MAQKKTLLEDLMKDSPRRSIRISRSNLCDSPVPSASNTKSLNNENSSADNPPKNETNTPAKRLKRSVSHEDSPESDNLGQVPARRVTRSMSKSPTGSGKSYASPMKINKRKLSVNDKTELKVQLQPLHVIDEKDEVKVNGDGITENNNNVDKINAPSEETLKNEDKKIEETNQQDSVIGKTDDKKSPVDEAQENSATNIEEDAEINKIVIKTTPQKQSNEQNDDNTQGNNSKLNETETNQTPNEELTQNATDLLKEHDQIVTIKINDVSIEKRQTAVAVNVEDENSSNILIVGNNVASPQNETNLSQTVLSVNQNEEEEEQNLSIVNDDGHSYSPICKKDVPGAVLDSPKSSPEKKTVGQSPDVKSVFLPKPRSRDDSMNEDSGATRFANMSPRKRKSDSEYERDFSTDEINVEIPQSVSPAVKLVLESSSDEGENEIVPESLLDDEAVEVSEEESVRNDCNEIVDEGESLNSTESEIDSNESYECDSFLVEDDNVSDILLSSDDEVEKKIKENSWPSRSKRIIPVESSGDEIDNISLLPYGGKSPSVMSVNQISSVDSDTESIKKLSEMMEPAISFEKQRKKSQNTPKKVMNNSQDLEDEIKAAVSKTLAGRTSTSNQIICVTGEKTPKKSKKEENLARKSEPRRSSLEKKDYQDIQQTVLKYLSRKQSNSAKKSPKKRSVQTESSELIKDFCDITNNEITEPNKNNTPKTKTSEHKYVKSPTKILNESTKSNKNKSHSSYSPDDMFAEEENDEIECDVFEKTETEIVTQKSPKQVESSPKTLTKRKKTKTPDILDETNFIGNMFEVAETKLKQKPLKKANRGSDIVAKRKKRKVSDILDESSLTGNMFEITETENTVESPKKVVAKHEKRKMSDTIGNTFEVTDIENLHDQNKRTPPKKTSFTENSFEVTEIENNTKIVTKSKKKMLKNIQVTNDFVTVPKQKNNKIDVLDDSNTLEDFFNMSKIKMSESSEEIPQLIKPPKKKSRKRKAKTAAKVIVEIKETIKKRVRPNRLYRLPNSIQIEPISTKSTTVNEFIPRGNSEKKRTSSNDKTVNKYTEPKQNIIKKRKNSENLNPSINHQVSNKKLKVSNNVEGNQNLISKDKYKCSLNFIAPHKSNKSATTKTKLKDAEIIKITSQQRGKKSTDAILKLGASKVKPALTEETENISKTTTNFFVLKNNDIKPSLSSFSFQKKLKIKSFIEPSVSGTTSKFITIDTRSSNKKIAKKNK